MILILSTILCFSSQSWLMMWIFIEINTVRFCRIIMKEIKYLNKKNPSSLLYLLIQCVSSLIFLVFIIIISETRFILIFPIILKTGRWPFHLWYISALNYLNLKINTIFIIISWQKLIPIFIIINVRFDNLTIIIFILLTLILPISILKDLINFKKVIILSSVNNNSWFLLSTFLSYNVIIIYFLIYSLSLKITIRIIGNIKELIFVKNKITLWIIFFLFGNLCGIPPLFVFFRKLIIVKVLTRFNIEFIFLMILCSCYFSYFYLQRGLNYYLYFSPVKNIIIKEISINDKLLNMFIFTIIILLIFIYLL